MNLVELLKDYLNEALPIEITGLQLDSKALQPGDLFFALAGSRVHGMKYAEQAIAKGAVAILYDPLGDGFELASKIKRVPCYGLKDLDQKLGLIADHFYRHPSMHLNVIGITGTNGKTSCSHFLANSMDDAAVLGTLGWGVLGGLHSTTHTTPDALEVQRILSSLKQQGIKTVAMEASSHGLDQNRVQGVRFQHALYTNISHDHLDYHPSMEAYVQAKLRLLECDSLKSVAYNADDALIAEAMNKASNHLRKIAFTLKPNRSVDTLSAIDVQQLPEGIEIKVEFNRENARFFAGVQGEFNVENMLATASVMLGMNFSLNEVKERLERIRPVPGRMEFVPQSSAVIDYAHTPDALAKVLKGLRKRCVGSLWLVFGCGGDRDKTKRRKMGEIASNLADRLVLTDDNPRNEAGDAIVADILKGCKHPYIKVIRDRRQAIEYALNQAGGSDVVLIAGKGHECYQEIAGIKHHFSDFETVENLLHEASASHRAA